MDPEDVLEEHWSNRRHFGQTGRTRRGGEQELRVEIAADLELKETLEEKLQENHARIAANEPAIQDLTSHTFQAKLANKKVASMDKVLSLELDTVTYLISTVLEFIS